MIKNELPKESYKALIQSNGSAVYFFRFDAEEMENTIVCSEETVIVHDADYAKMVSALVHVKYTADGETTVIANILAEPESEQRIAEFNAYQEWRTYCKATAKEFFGI